MVNFEETKEFLSGCERHELRDHAFGDMEMHWTKDGVTVAEGYIGQNYCGVMIKDGPEFIGPSARTLISLGTLAQVNRNDTTGPPEFTHRNVFERENNVQEKDD